MRTSLEPEEEAFLSRPQLYGGFGGFQREDKAFYMRSQRQRMNIVSICQCLILPWLFFCSIYAATSFLLHDYMPGLGRAILGLGLVVVVACGGAALAVFLSKFAEAKLASIAREPSWFVFLFFTLLAAWILGVALGNLNFVTNLQPYYDYMNLNTYTYVNPATTRGQQLMDAGRVLFTNVSALDLRRSMGFRNMDTYCVAPITISSPTAGALLPLTSYDFWAVGLDCCSANTADFHCGEFNNPRAHGGLRLLKDEQRAFFRLAVQQAEAQYSIKASHPLFFYWAQDPTAEMNSYRDEGIKYYLVGMLVHFAWQLLCVALAAVGFARVGRF